jgi:hypothetical protein
MTKWVEKASLVQDVLAEQKAAAEKTGLKYDATIEYWQAIQTAWNATDPLLIGARMIEAQKHAKAGNQAELNKDIDYLNERIATIQQTHDEWVNLPAAPAVLESLQTLLVDSLKHWKPLADEAQTAASQGDWETYFRNLDALTDYDHVTEFLDEIRRVSKQVHLTTLIPLKE